MPWHLRRSARGFLLVWGTSLLPVVLWLLARPLEDRLGTWQTALGGASRMLGLMGLALMAWAVILAARLRLFEQLFDGMDRAYRHHHIVGGTAFVLVLLHPTLLAVRYASVSIARAAALWVPTPDDWALTFGQIALYLMVPALLATIFGRLRHVAFVRMQQLLGLMLVPATLHVLLIRGDVRAFWPLRVYLLALVLAALAAYIYHPVLTRLLTSRYQYVVEEIRALGPDITELILAPRRRLLAFVPGQFAFLTIQADPPGEEAHPFSIASSPRDSRVRFVIKHLGDWTTGLAGVRPGTMATVAGPYGTFSHRWGRSSRQVWVAGGIGIAPFLAMARSLDDTPRYEIDLWFGYRDADDPFLAELDDLARTRPRLRTFAVHEATDGFVTVALLESQGALAGKEFLLCGPAPMMDALRAQLMDRGVSESRIHFEDFAFR